MGFSTSPQKSTTTPQTVNSALLKVNFKNKDVYNPSISFKHSEKTLILGRTESRDSEKDSQVVYFEQTETGDWLHIIDAPTHDLQDPFICQIQGKWILGGVYVDWETYSYRTDFYIGDTPFDLKKFTSGPSGMKDIRLLALKNGKIAIFTRPQGGKYKKGKIGFTLINDLSEFNTEAIANAPLLEDQFGDETWGGVNQAIELPDGKIGLIGHWAWFVNENRKYTAVAFELDPETRQCTHMKVIATRDQFPESAAKRPDLTDVIFPAGVIPHVEKKGFVTLYAGLSDTSIGIIEIPYPFSN